MGLPLLDFGFLSEMNRMPFSIVHAHAPFSAGVVARRLAAKRHIPFVATFHSKYRVDLENGVPFKWLVDMEVNRIVKFYESADEVWIPQASMEPTLREYGFRGAVQVVENGNDFVSPEPEYQRLRQQMRQELGLGRHETMLLFVGQHIRAKNIGLIIDSVAHQRPAVEAVFLRYGQRTA